MSLVGHTYVSDAYRAEPGRATTALGRHPAADLLVEPDRFVDQPTQVIGWYGVERVLARPAAADPPLYAEVTAGTESLCGAEVLS